MHLLDLINSNPTLPNEGVPDWMLGYFKRHSISFSDGTTDLKTHVCWLQSRNFTIDLRLPVAAEQVSNKPLEDYSETELRTLGNYEGWVASCEWQQGTLSWLEATSLQYHDRWTEPGILHRVGNCMIELSPNGSYIEDWRLQRSAPGPLLGLRLIDDICLDTEEVLHQGGGLIVCGDHAALVLGRPPSTTNTGLPNQYREDLIAAKGLAERLKPLMQFETSVATGTLSDGYRVQLSSCPSRVNESLLSLDGFEFDSQHQEVIHEFRDNSGNRRQRRFTIDTVEPECQFSQTTSVPAKTESWLSQEAETLTRYTQPLF